MEAALFLDQTDHGVEAAISILDPAREDLRPRGLTSVPHVLEMAFDDVEVEDSECLFPTLEIAQEIINFIKQTSAESWLIHCHMGKSRSTACALALLALRSGVATAREELLKVAPRATPNVLLAKHFDQICGFNGELLSIAQDFDFQLLKQLAQVKIYN